MKTYPIVKSGYRLSRSLVIGNSAGVIGVLHDRIVARTNDENLIKRVFDYITAARDPGKVAESSISGLMSSVIAATQFTLTSNEGEGKPTTLINGLFDPKGRYEYIIEIDRGEVSKRVLNPNDFKSMLISEASVAGSDLKRYTSVWPAQGQTDTRFNHASKVVHERVSSQIGRDRLIAINPKYEAIYRHHSKMIKEERTATIRLLRTDEVIDILMSSLRGHLVTISPRVVVAKLNEIALAKAATTGS